ncbi:hypothetical protein D1007_45901 [Hordeum vulgare]|nr:hypothetical protein D1007_45901 [Hordeum vulgare]
MEITRSFYLWWQDGVIFEPFTYTCPSFMCPPVHGLLLVLFLSAITDSPMISCHLVLFDYWLLCNSLCGICAKVLLMAIMSNVHSEVYLDQISSLVYMVLPLSQNNCLNFELTLVQSCIKLKTLILRRREYVLGLGFCVTRWKCANRDGLLSHLNAEMSHRDVRASAMRVNADHQGCKGICNADQCGSPGV